MFEGVRCGEVGPYGRGGRVVVHQPSRVQASKEGPEHRATEQESGSMVQPGRFDDDASFKVGNVECQAMLRHLDRWNGMFDASFWSNA